MPSQYPTYDLGGPRPRRCQIVDKKWPIVLGPVFGDGGRDTFLGSATPSEIVWELEYDGLLPHEAGMLDAHNDECLDTHLSFPFRDLETGVLHTGVKYMEYQRGSRSNRQINKRLVRLVKRP